MVGRVKFQVWGKHGWCTAYVWWPLLTQNAQLFASYGIKHRCVNQGLAK